MEKIFNIFKKPTYSYKELPVAIQSEVTKTIIIGAFCSILAIVISIRSLTFSYAIYALICVPIYFVAFFFLWYRYFIYDKVLIYEGEIIDAGTATNNVVKKGFRKIVDYSRKTYKLRLDNGLVISVIKNHNKKYKANLKVRIYILPDAISEKQDKSYLINHVLFMEFISKEK